MHIDFLGEHVELVPEIAAWLFDEWGHLRPGDTLEKRLEAVQQRTHVDRLPLTLIALSGAVPVGTVALVESEYEVPGREDLSPWLTDLYVPAELRRQGIGGALLERAMRVAAELGHRRIHACAFEHLGFYRRRGWEPQETDLLAGREITLLRAETSRRQTDSAGA